MLKYIFLDESGDLGFAEKSSKFFIITLMLCNEDTEINLKRIIKRVREKLIKKKLKKYPELKGNNSSDKIRKEVLERFVKNKAEVFTIIMDKSKVYEYLKEKKHKLYNYISNLILNECSFDTNNICLTVDKSKSNRSLRDDFDNYLRFSLKNKLASCNLSIKHENSQNEYCLQVLDFVSWAIFRKYEQGDEDFFNIIKERIIIKKELFQNNSNNKSLDPRG